MGGVGLVFFPVNFARRIFEISREYTGATRPLPLLTYTTAAGTSILRSIPPVDLWRTVFSDAQFSLLLSFRGFLSKCSPTVVCTCTEVYTLQSGWHGTLLVPWFSTTFPDNLLSRNYLNENYRNLLWKTAIFLLKT